MEGLAFRVITGGVIKGTGATRLAGLGGKPQELFT